MAYENMTYEVILDRMINRVIEKYPNLDYREGSLIFNALAPAALELAVLYTELDNAMNESFIGTASREYLYKLCEQVGMDVTAFEAQAGIHKGEFNVEVPIGSRWNCDLYNYTVTEFIGMDGEYYTYKLVCETVGSTPNNQTGILTPITDNPDGLEYAEITECLIEGENELSDEAIREAYGEFVVGATTDGNIAQYKKWCNEYKGIGNYKIFPLWNGANTVKVSILSVSNNVASDELVAEFQEYLDPNSDGMGNGVAPIGAFVTVATATEIPVNITANITLKAGYTDTSMITTAVEKYLSEIAYEKKVVPYMNVGAVIIGTECVEFIDNLLINDGTSDIRLEEEQIAVLKNATWVVNE